MAKTKELASIECTLEKMNDFLDWRVSVLEQAIIDADKFPMPLAARTILREALEKDEPERKRRKQSK